MEDKRKPQPQGDCGSGILGGEESESFGDVTGPDAARAHFDASDGTLLDRFDLLQVGMPSATGFVVGVTDVISEAGTFSADIAYFRHNLTP